MSIPVFVGSTLTDLGDHREAVLDALTKLQYLGQGMEFFGSRPDNPREECLRAVRACRIYIGIFGMRYGSVDPESSRSFTHLEYDEAQRIGLPSLLYVMDEERHLVLPRDVDTGDSAAKLQALKAELRRKHVVGTFTSETHLASLVVADLPALLSRTGTESRPGELARVVSSIPRVDWVDEKRFSFLKRRLGEFAVQFPSDTVLRETIEYLLSGDRLAAAFLIHRTCGVGFRDAIDLAMRVDNRLREIVEEGLAVLAKQRGVDDRQIAPDSA